MRRPCGTTRSKIGNEMGQWNILYLHLGKEEENPSPESNKVLRSLVPTVILVRLHAIVDHDGASRLPKGYSAKAQLHIPSFTFPPKHAVKTGWTPVFDLAPDLDDARVHTIPGGP